ncbi:hypothetical protein HDU85_003589 [Gaertneriomyces sp. JEL0708]|nr:hypothetical protein HDU85_003589 [Gaertneriomyces sp. JEL0708]
MTAPPNPTPNTVELSEIHIGSSPEGIPPPSPAPLTKNRRLPHQWGSQYTSPESTANWVSRFTYWWLNPVFYVGWHRPLDERDMWRLGPEWRVENLQRGLVNAWEKEVAQCQAAAAANSSQVLHADNSESKLTTTGKKTSRSKERQPSVWRAIRNAWWKRLIPAAILKLVADVTLVFTPFIVKYILEFVNESRVGEGGGERPPIGVGIGWAVGLLFLQLISTLSNHQYFMHTCSQGLAIRATLTAIIYQKSLRLSSSARHHFPSGKIMTIVSTDAHRIELFTQFVHVLWAAPLQIVVICVLLLTQLGVSALAGVAVLVVLTPLQGRIVKRLGVIRKTVAPLTDKRVKLIQEILAGIRVIKMFAWERPFLSKTGSIRKQEIAQIFKRSILSAFVTALSFGVPIFSASVAIVIYAVTADDLDATKIFPALAWFNQLRFPLMFLPQVVVGLADFRVATGRIGELLMADEVEGTKRTATEGNDVKEGDWAVKIENGEFVWESIATLDPKATESGKRNSTSGEPKSLTLDKQATPEQGGLTKQPEGNIAASPLPGSLPSPSSPTASTPFSLRNISLSLPRNSLTAIIGPVGSGKSSLLLSLLHETSLHHGTVSLPSSLSYVPQTPFILNASLRSNILFGLPYDRERYLRVIRDCALEMDLKILPDGDQTIIGERGVMLSGGQKQRVSLARAVYAEKECVLLDDVLSAVDTHVGKYLFKNCLLGALVNSTRILVTHQLHILPQVDYIISMKNGEIAEQGTYEDLMAKDAEFADLMQRHGGGGAVDEKEAIEAVKDLQTIAAESAIETTQLLEIEKGLQRPIDAKDPASPKATTSEEERATGSVDMKVWFSYIRAAGSKHFVFLLLFLLTLIQASRIGGDFWLVQWTNNTVSSFDTGKYVAVYFAFGVFQMLTLYGYGLFFAFSGTRAARVLHEAMIERVIHAPVGFFDTTPLGRVINRFSKDTDAIDTQLSESFRMFTTTLAVAIGTFVLIIYATPLFAIPLAPVLVLYWIVQKVYRAASRELKRLDSTTRSPLYAHFSETLNGVTSIRAYNAQERFARQTVDYINTNNSPYFLLLAAQRWLGVRLELLGCLLVFFAAMFGVLARGSSTLSAALLGLSLSYALQVTGTLNWCVRQMTETELAMNAVERVEHYGKNLEVEPLLPLPSDENDDDTGRKAAAADVSIKTVVVPPQDWPTQGFIQIRDLSLRYSSAHPVILHRLSLDIPAGSKLAVVGRTGSGKSSLIQGLFRLIEPCVGSQILIDGINTQDIALETLRKNIAIIPQDPVLFSGTLRSNLDPFNQYSVEELRAAVEKSHLSRSLSGSTEAGDILDTEISTNGENLSLGQRQLVCLARAMVVRAKILVLDEATANVDLETDRVIQECLRKEFVGVTVICVAHRLNTIIDYDRVLVLSAGTIAEYDTPRALLAVSDGAFSRMIDETGTQNAEFLRGLVR